MMNVNDLMKAGYELFSKPGSAADKASPVKTAAPVPAKPAVPAPAAPAAPAAAPKPSPAATLGHFKTLKNTPLGAPTPPMPQPPKTHGAPAWASPTAPGGMGVGTAAAAKAFPGMPAPGAQPDHFGLAGPATGAAAGTPAAPQPKPMGQTLAQRYPGPAQTYARAAFGQAMGQQQPGNQFMNKVYGTQGQAPGTGGMVDPRRQRNPRAKFSRTPYVRDMPSYLRQQQETAQTLGSPNKIKRWEEAARVNAAGGNQATADYFNQMIAKERGRAGVAGPAGGAAAGAEGFDLPAGDPGFTELPPEEKMPQPAAAGPQGPLPQPGLPQPGALGATQPMFSPKPQAGHQADIGGAMGNLVGGHMPARSVAPPAPQPQQVTPSMQPADPTKYDSMNIHQPETRPTLLGGIQDAMGGDFDGLSGNMQNEGVAPGSDPNLGFVGPTSGMLADPAEPPMQQQTLDEATALYEGDDPFAGVGDDPFAAADPFGERETDPDYQALMNL